MDCFDITSISQKLSLIPQQNDKADGLQDNKTLTAVALIVKCSGSELELLYIQRASDDRDPWSGNIAFPGGRLDDSDTGLRMAAEREAMEELSIDLGRSTYLGRLYDIIGANLPVRVSCFVYAVDETPEILPNHEIADAFWVSLDTLNEPARHIESSVRFAEKEFTVPAIRLPQAGKPVLWGITYRLTMQFISIVTQKFDPINFQEEKL